LNELLARTEERDAAVSQVQAWRKMDEASSFHSGWKNGKILVTATR
jgi:hypothetical protein